MKLASCCLAAVALLALPTAELVAQSEGATKSNVVTTSTGHPEKQSAAVAVHTSKPKPAPKSEKIPKATSASSSWVPGDYYWDGNDWNWAGGFWLDQPWSGAMWIPGHWSDRFWGWTWVPGYWG
jgi:hypothetical protein